MVKIVALVLACVLIAMYAFSTINNERVHPLPPLLISIAYLVQVAQW
jgi:hypothetical protein